MYRRRRRRRGSPWWRILLLLAVLAGTVFWAGRSLLSPPGRYWTAQNIWRGKPSRVKPVVEEAMARAARSLELPPPAPQLFCAPDSTGKTLCSSSIQLEPGVSTLQANAAFTGTLDNLGLVQLSGVEDAAGTVRLLFQAGRRTTVELVLVPSSPAALDTAVAPAPDLPPVPVRVRLALIVSLEKGTDPRLDAFDELPGTFTFAIHPEDPDAREIADRARRQGMEVLVNLPMEPKGFPTRDPGENAVLVDMSGRSIRRLVKRDLERLGTVVGVKTLFGSLAVEDRDVMRAILEELTQPKLLFVDDTREEYSSAAALGREIGIQVLSIPHPGDIDYRWADVASIGQRFDAFVTSCQKKGYGVAVIRPREATIEVLRERLPGLAHEGIAVMGLTEVARLEALE